MKSPATSLLRGLAAGVLSASLTTGCLSTVVPTVKGDEPSMPRRSFDWTLIAPKPENDVEIPPIPPVERLRTPEASKAAPRSTMQPTSRPRGSRTVSGVPTWYCLAGWSRCTRGYPDGPGIDLYAAAGPSLRVGQWRGRIVTVCARVCIQVRLIDYCACGGDHFLDLYHDAWVKLGQPQRATVSW